MHTTPRSCMVKEWSLTAICAVATAATLYGVSPAAAADNPGAARGLKVQRSRATGMANFVTARDRGPIAKPAVAKRGKPVPADFFRRHGDLFGVTDVATQLRETGSATDALLQTHTTFGQVHRGVPVFGARLKVHTDAAGNTLAANGTFIPNIQIDPTPRLTSTQASVEALDEVARLLGAGLVLEVASSKLYVYRENLTKGIPGLNLLVYEVEVRGSGVREFVYVDAHKGGVVDRITGIHESINRRVYEGGFGSGFLVWSEGDSTPFGDVDIDNLIDYTEDTYNVVASMTNGAFLSWDGADGIMHTVNNDPTISCPNANWNGLSTNYCTGVTADDTVAHEWGHAYTDSTHNLIYQWQSGALNESYSDIYGEVIDFLNGSGTDSPIPVRAAGDCSVFGGNPPPDLTINAPAGIAGSYPAGDASFNPTGPITVTASVEWVVDGGSSTEGCQTLVGFTPGNIALIDRGTCAFVDKVDNAVAAGAVGVIIVNNAGDGVIFMGGTGPKSIPAVMVGQSNGQTIKDNLPGVNATISLQVSTNSTYRWLAGEDDPSFGGAIRDMWNPNCFGDPGKVTDTGQYHCDESDSGGVHTNSGIPNHCFALLVDGGSYNGFSITGMGLTKAFQIYWRAQTVYQNPATGFAGHADALEQSCQDLVGVNLFALDADSPLGVLSGEIIDANDCAQVANAIAAVELRAEPTFCQFTTLLDPNTPPLCSAPLCSTPIFEEDWESGLSGWTVGTRDIVNPATFDTPDWAVVGDLPNARAGSAAFVADPVIGDCASDIEAGVLFLQSPTIGLPAWASVPRLAFDHWIATELAWDGANVKISVNGGSFSLIPSSDFTFNAYNSTLEFSDNPMGGEEAFTGTDGGAFTGSWGQSHVDLSGFAGPGDDVVLRFEMGMDGCNGRVGWYIDDMTIYACESGGCDDGVFCNGAETCGVDGNCQSGTPACEGQLCDETNDLCVECLINEDCVDSLFCNGDETCGGSGACESGTPVDCNDGIDCTADSCDEALDTCENTPDDASCDDFLYCTGTETCDPIEDCVASGDPCQFNEICNEDADSCEAACPAPDSPLAEGPTVVKKNRYFSLVPGNGGEMVALRVTLVSMPAGFTHQEGCQLWIGVPQSMSEASGIGVPGTGSQFTWAGLVPAPVFMDWGSVGLLHVSGEAVVPGSALNVQSISQSCELTQEPSYSLPLVVETALWGDIVSDCTANPCGPPQGVADFDDIAAIVDKFKNLPSAPIKARTDLVPAILDHQVDFTDIPAAVDGFRGLSYSFAAQPGCP